MTGIAIPAETSTIGRVSPEKPWPAGCCGWLTCVHGGVWLVDCCECARCQTLMPTIDQPASKGVIFIAGGQLLLHGSPALHTPPESRTTSHRTGTSLRAGSLTGRDMFALVFIVPLVLLVGAVLLPVAFLRSFGSRPWTAWGHGVLLALTGFCLASLTGLFTAGALVMDAGDVCLRPLEGLGHSSSDTYPTLRTKLFPFHAVCDDGRHSVDLVPGFVNPTLVVCLLALPVLLVGLGAARRRRAPGASTSSPVLQQTAAGIAPSAPTPQRAAAESPGPTPAPRMLSWVMAGLGLTALFLTLAGFFTLAAASLLALLVVTILVLHLRRASKGRPRR
ncbi:hypothetical protein JL107_16890 [Nakamurella flavida]|uniref:Uncharacterized protein n=1 Tax=Nakamurella flavida TaxID=363630 RepID=A0A939C4I4_9ACTN|nr:hypothetical protein [Nakamurella flavida]MBM9478126.1 hypothetical protein [Nakamurella flavida]MDP9778652.1 putative membrane protein YphA (DoxX/SURF4 family) [Nakamurella flavida]